MPVGAFKSAERVEDSDVESDSSATSSDASPRPEQTKAAVSSSSEEEGSASSEGETASDSEDDDSEEQPAATGVISGSSASVASSESASPAPVQSKKRKANGAAAAQTPKRPKSVAIDDTPARSSGGAQKSVPAKSAFAPPEGFAPLHLSRDGHAMLAADHVKGKELWHITVPSSISIKDLQEIDLSAARKGKKVMSSKGSDYGLFTVPDSQTGEKRLLVPQRGGDYVAAPTFFKKVFNLQQIMPDLSSIPSAQSGPPLVTEKPSVQQPTGLKTQHFPAGFEPTPSKPKKTVLPVKSAPAEGSAATPMSEMKKKKKRDKAEGAALDTPSKSEPQTEKKKKHKKRLSMDQ